MMDMVVPGREEDNLSREMMDMVVPGREEDNLSREMMDMVVPGREEDNLSREMMDMVVPGKRRRQRLKWNDGHGSTGEEKKTTYQEKWWTW